MQTPDNSIYFDGGEEKTKQNYIVHGTELRKPDYVRWEYCTFCVFPFRVKCKFLLIKRFATASHELRNNTVDAKNRCDWAYVSGAEYRLCRLARAAFKTFMLYSNQIMCLDCCSTCVGNFQSRCLPSRVSSIYRKTKRNNILVMTGWVGPELN